MKHECTCGRNLHAAKLYPLHCVCGEVHRGQLDNVVEDCVHLAEKIGVADCGCAGSRRIYRCRLHGLAMERKLKPGKVRATINGEKQCVEMSYCSVCPDDSRI